ncbi:uncharacterized protein BDR25DRAFT_314715 [Lindgomyces ingoldianus]|uniref:Uncharacterized protein n=1 Tax=Lindgomyces ingoldianus TaxID=673940 RepID=A0ACB6QU61_9PLEO|nr:uncharacterized protein BDR25DRAFT_314715 [Lindgomyces ingoldianus]KAF2470544.1 hypothetical protein BDR25DRAFT_314715 [Lindgomyces ingoldianus]
MSRPPTPSEVQSMLQHLDDDRRTAMTVSSVVCGVLSLVFVAMRVTARKLPGIPLGPDDWWMFASLFLYIGTPICFAWTTKYGAGRHVVLLTDGKAFATVSLLYLYGRIFPQRWFKLTLIYFGVFLALMTIVSLLVCVLQCIPIHKMWNSAASSGCVDFGRFALAMACVNITTDVVILIMPLPVVWGLRIRKTKKWLVSLSFIMGGSACVVCLIRLLFVLKVASTPDPTWDSIPSGITSTFELCVGIFAASFPTYRPLYKWLFPGEDDEMVGQSSGYASSSSRKWKRSQNQASVNNNIIKMTTIRNERGPREPDEERLYVIAKDAETSRDTFK